MASAEVDDAPELTDVVKSKPAVLEICDDPTVETCPNGGVPSLDTSAIMPDSDIESSTAVLLRNHPPERDRNGPCPFQLSSRADFTLMETFTISGKSCIVTLEEDHVSWVPRKSGGKKEVKKECLYLSDTFAVVPGDTNKKSSEPRSFTLHALQCRPGSPGEMRSVRMKCPDSETCQIWCQQIYHQMQNFGNRPRRLYVVVNPVSGEGKAVREWKRVERLFQLAQIHTDVIYTQRRFYAREVIQSLDFAQYDGIIAVGGDGTINEILNGLLIQTQQQAGVNLHHSRFVPVTPNIRLGVIPAGLTNTIARSIFGCSSSLIAAAQIMLGCSTPIDVCSVSNNGQLLMFSAGPMSYGFWSDTVLFSQDFSWLGNTRFDVATLRALLTHRPFEGEISFIPMEDPEVVKQTRERCFNRCSRCSNFDSSLESPSATNEKGASIMAAYSEVDRVDENQWKTLAGQFSSIMACPHMCSSRQAPKGMSPWGHLGNGCADLIMLTRCSKMNHAKWLIRQRKGNSSQFDLPYVQIQRVKEFKFRVVLRSTATSPTEHIENSVENLVQEVDDDEMTNSRAAARTQQRGEGHGVAMPTSRWNIDGDELHQADVDVRVHRHLISIFARGVEPLESESASSSVISVDRTEQEDLLPTS